MRVAAEELGDGIGDLAGAQHADLDGVDPDIGHQRQQLLVTKLAGISWMPVTPVVFCAVSAVITEVP